jgi:hypothetical protein
MIFWPGCAAKQRSTASSAEMVLPLPVGAPSSTFSSVWYIVWKICRTDHRQKLASQTVAQCALCLLRGCRSTANVLERGVDCSCPTCVWMALKWLNLYSPWNAGLSRADTGSGSRSSSSCRNRRRAVSHACHSCCTADGLCHGNHCARFFTALGADWCAVVAPPGHAFGRHSAAAMPAQGASRLKGEQGRGSRCAAGGAPAAAAP